VLGAGAAPDVVERVRGPVSLEFAHGRWIGREQHPGFVWTGRYAVRGNVIRLIVGACRPRKGCAPASIAAYRWSVYRDRLSLQLLSGTPAYVGLFAKPLTRVR
jgi:hypothetical protein